jgi:hypothetical protein
MDRLRDLLAQIKNHDWAAGQFLGLLNLLIGRRIMAADGTEVSRGATWRVLAAYLKQARWDKDAVRELGLDPAALPPRDRMKYWYAAISLAKVDSAEATRAGDRMAEHLTAQGYTIGPAPRGKPSL